MSLREVIYFSAASALGLFTFIFFFMSGNARLKQRLWIVVHILGGGLFIAFMLGRELTPLGTFFTVFFALGFVYLSLSNSRFCGECASLIFGPERPEWRGNCPSCGVPLPWSYYRPPSGSPTASAGGPGAESSPGPPADPVRESARAEAEIARAFETEGEHHATTLSPGGDTAGPSAPDKVPGDSRDASRAPEPEETP